MHRPHSLDIDRHLRAPDARAVLPSAIHPRDRARDKLLALLFGYPTEDCDQQWPYRSFHVEPRLPHADDFHAAAIEVEHRLHVPDHRAPEAVERPHDEDIERAAVRIDHHLLERPSRFRDAGLLFIPGHEFVAAGAHDAVDVGPLVFVRLLVRADAEVNGGVLHWLGVRPLTVRGHRLDGTGENRAETPFSPPSNQTYGKRGPTTGRRKSLP